MIPFEEEERDAPEEAEGLTEEVAWSEVFEALQEIYAPYIKERLEAHKALLESLRDAGLLSEETP